MNLKTELRQENSKAPIHRMAAYIGDNPDRFAQLMLLFFGADDRIAEKAASVLSHCADRHSFLLHPYVPKLIINLEKTKLAAVKRNTLRVLQYIVIPEGWQGKLTDCCFKFLVTDEPVAVKVFAMSVLANLAKQEPDLKNELKICIEDQLPYASPAFVSRAKKVLRLLDNLS